jgi:arsenical pump membrane protein
VTSSSWLAIVISMVGVIGMLARPFRTKEWQWAAGAAIVLVLLRTLSPGAAWAAVVRGGDVYAFLIGIMTLSEVARHEGLFDAVAARLLAWGGGSRARLFDLVYALGTVVTVLLSNDTTAVVLTPAIATALARTKGDRLPYLYICAFIANAASFVLPISNPANLVVFNAHLPPLGAWLAGFWLPSLASVALTYAAMRLLFFRSLRGTYTPPGNVPRLEGRGVLAACAVSAATLALVIAAALHGDVGLVALGGALVALAVVTLRDRGVAPYAMRHLSWGILPLVAGLFVLVDALDRAGVVTLLRGVLHEPLLAGAIITAADNIFNNLPVALATGAALAHAGTSTIVRASVVGVDLGPNLSVTGSLATLLWLDALRRADIRVTAWQFLRVGMIVTLPALAAALLVLR